MAKKYVFPHTLVRGDQSFAPGTPVTLGDKDAEILCKTLGGRAFTPPVEPEAAPAKPTGKALVETLAKVIGLFAPDNEELWTKSGKPSVTALEKELGFDITQEERDAAYLSLQKDGKK